MATYDFQRLEEVLLPACRQAFRQLFAKYRGEHFYGLGLWTDGGLDWLLPTALSEEGLDAILRECRAKGWYADETGEELRLSAKWSPEDSPHHLEGQEYFANVDKIMSDISDKLLEIDIEAGWEEFETFYAQVINSICNVFTSLDSEGLFGVGLARQSVFVTLMTMDQDDSILEIGQRVNPAESTRWFSAEWTRKKELQARR